MRITDIRTVVAGNPWKNWVFVKLATDAGLIGLGIVNVIGACLYAVAPRKITSSETSQ